MTLKKQADEAIHSSTKKPLNLWQKLACAVSGVSIVIEDEVKAPIKSETPVRPKEPEKINPNNEIVQILRKQTKEAIRESADSGKFNIFQKLSRAVSRNEGTKWVHKWQA